MSPSTLELAALASQHHMSEYNRLKYGHRGSPVSYAPLSLDVVRTLRARQEKYATQRLWWPCASPVDTASSPVIPVAEQRAALATGASTPHPDLHHQLSMAISESIPQLHSPDTTKTSETHPIHVSQVIPPESLVAISSHLVPCKKPCPILFQVDLPHSSDLDARYPHANVLPIRSASIPAVLPSSQHNPRHSSVSSTLNTKIPLSPLPIPSSRILLSLKRTFKNHTISDAPIYPSAQPTLHGPLPPVLASSATYALHPFSPYVHPSTAPSSPSKLSRFRASKSSAGQDAAIWRPLKLGNLLLSSCPGKKVRLSGPVRGRSAICRALDVDLRRMKMLGTRCVVCCLDDEELQLLVGTSWMEYCQIAHQEGLDVLRIPLPEGLVPLSPKALDADLDRIIKRYTLQGMGVLVHCRGGIGRAGLVACCWMLKLGLCGWIETDATVTAVKTRHDDTLEFRWDSETVVRRDTLQMVERVIEVIRRRRSVKAIETLEQVQFLVEYIDYLRSCGRASSNSYSSSPSS